jgi:hypothetical protein
VAVVTRARRALDSHATSPGDWCPNQAKEAAAIEDWLAEGLDVISRLTMTSAQFRIHQTGLRVSRCHQQGHLRSQQHGKAAGGEPNGEPTPPGTGQRSACSGDYHPR